MIADVIQNLKNFNNSKVGIKCLVCFKHVNSSEIDAVVEENNAYHGQCYKDRFKPRCSSCNLFFSDKSKQIQYKDEKFHLECFKCNKCQSPLGNQKCLTKADKPYCIECFKSLFVVNCHECFQPIRRVSKCVDINGIHYHGECV